MRPVCCFLAFLVTALAGCGGGGGEGGDADGGTELQAPVLTDVSIASDGAAASLTIAIDGSFTFSDPNGDVNGGSFNYTYGGTTFSFPMPPALAGLTSATVVFQLQAVLDSNTGSGKFPTWLVDGTGRSSNIYEVTFTQLWTRQFGTVLEDAGYGIAVDGADNVLVAGTTYGDLDGEINPGGPAVFVIKYAPDTTRAWTRVFGSASADAGRAVSTDSAGNVYVTGDTVGSTFDGVGAIGLSDGFLTKFDGGGTRQWTKVFGTTAEERVHAVATDSGNNVYVVGETTGDLDGPGDQSNAGGWDAFLIKFDSSGNIAWIRMLGTTGADAARGVAIDGAGYVYVTGAMEGSGGGVANADVFIAKYGSNGAQAWLKTPATDCTEWGNGIATAASGHVYVVGMIISPCAFDGNTASGLRDAFVAQLDGSDGDVQWVRQFGTSQYDTAHGVATDSAGNAYVTGFLDSVTFNDDSEGHAIFLARYDGAGNQVWLRQDTAGSSFGNQGRATAIDGADNVFITGMLHGQLDGHASASAGEDDVFILKYDIGGTRR